MQIPSYALVFCTFEWRVSKYFFKSGFRHFFPIIFIVMENLGDGGKGDFLCWPGESVPGTNILADIASKHPVVKFIFHRVWNQQILQLDGKI